MSGYQVPTVPEIAPRYRIADGLLRYPLIPCRTLVTSTFVPTLMNYFEVVHFMDQLIASNVFFKQQLHWHPFVSRLYFAVLAYYQTLRAMDHAKLGTTQTRQLTTLLLKDLPPEQLPVPGPLVPILNAICCTSPESDLYRLVCPRIPDNPGPRTRPGLISNTTSMLLMPNIPLLLGLANSIINASPDSIPDYTVENTFSDAKDMMLSGYVFKANAWDQQCRSLLCQPGLHRTPETLPELDIRFNIFGSDLSLPVIDEHTDLYSLEDFTQLNTVSWIDNLIPTMSHYCEFFKESGNLGQCEPYGPKCCLMRSRPTQITSDTDATNICRTITHAFPNKFPYKHIYDQRSYEETIPQRVAATGQYASINTRCDYPGLGNWARMNIPNGGRTGPYWQQNPSTLHQPDDRGFLEVKNKIISYYYIREPSISKLTDH